VSSTATKPADWLEAMGLPRHDLTELPASAKRFPDGAEYRVEIPSTEGPEALAAVLEEAARLAVVVHRVSQGSGVVLLTDAELKSMATTAADARVEVSLFVRPSAGWGLSVSARASAGSAVAASAHGQDQVAACLEDAVRASLHGFRSVLIADLGVLSAFGSMRAGGGLPPDMQAKVSVMLPAANAAAAKVFEGLGANTLNVPSDLGLPQLAAIRAAIDIPIDIYVEAPDNLGATLRYNEIPEIVRVCSPVYLKFGLRNAPDLYPWGGHLRSTSLAMTRERVRRARLGLELMERSGYPAVASKAGAADLAVPRP
jgi:hypothetical protein